MARRRQSQVRRTMNAAMFDLDALEHAAIRLP
jgi:hypothetical protein